MARLLREFISLEQNEKIIEEAKKARVDKTSLSLPAILQRADAKNQNKRLYPRGILDREIENYKKLVSEGRSGGQLDHPECFCEGNQILTRDGWKNFKDISDNEYVYTLNRDLNNIELKRINKKVSEHYSGIMYKIKGRNIDTAVTPGHKFWIIDRYGEGSFVSIEEIYNNRTKYSKSYIPKLGNWSAPEEKSVFVLKGIEEFSKHCSKEFINKNSLDLKINFEVWSSFFGLYLAEGSCVDRNKSNSYLVKITQKNEENKIKIRNLLSRFPSSIEWKEVEFGDGKVDFVVHDARLHAYLSILGKSYEKYIPFDMKQLSPPYLQNILDWFILGDGRIRNFCGYQAVEVFSVSKRLIEDLNEILLKSGGSGNVYIRKPYDRKIEGRLIKEENQRNLYFLHFSTTRGIYLNKDFLKIEPFNYDGQIYCVSVPNETFYVMDNGNKTFWSGNSSVVELKEVSHKIADIWWEGNDVKGIVEIHPSFPRGIDALGLIEGGLKVGISSRGVGETVRNESSDCDVVDESFMLICFDLVSEPSTQEAWLMREGKEIPYNLIHRAIPRVDRINRILDEILKK